MMISQWLDSRAIQRGSRGLGDSRSHLKVTVIREQEIISSSNMHADIRRERWLIDLLVFRHIKRNKNPIFSFHTSGWFIRSHDGENILSERYQYFIHKRRRRTAFDVVLAVRDRVETSSGIAESSKCLSPHAHVLSYLVHKKNTTEILSPSSTHRHRDAIHQFIFLLFTLLPYFLYRFAIFRRFATIQC